MAQRPRVKFFIGLVHYPVYNKNRSVISTATTNYDIHDISRASATYNLDGYFVITPLESQRKLADRIISYWRDGPGKQLNYTRTQSLQKTYVAESVGAVCDIIKQKYGYAPLLVATSAKVRKNNKKYITISAFKEMIKKQSVLLLFGTGWGMTKEILNDCSYILPAIKGGVSYNHLSVRSAVSIMLDRIRGR